MERTYFMLPYILDGQKSYLIWYGGQPDGILLDESGMLLHAPDRHSLEVMAERQGILLGSQEAGTFDLDRVASWLELPREGDIDCAAFLNAWNLFGDVFASVESPGASWEPADAKSTYDKLFWGNNLPSVTPPGKRYVPLWTARDRDVLRQVFGRGLSQFRKVHL